MITSTGNRYSQWKELNRRIAEDIRRLYNLNEIAICTAVEVISDHVFDSDLKYDWCPDVAEPNYERTLGSLLKNVGEDSKGRKVSSSNGSKRKRNGTNGDDSCDRAPDPDQIKWMKETMREALDYYYMFGMCPFRMIIGPDMTPKIIIPNFASGNFIARINDDTDMLEVGWLSYHDKYQRQGQLEPDPKVGVYMWSQFKPMIDESNPFKSTVSRLRRDYQEFRIIMQNNLMADRLASSPLIVTASNEKIGSIDNLSWDQALGDSIIFDPENPTVDDSEKQRINDSSLYESSRISSSKAMQDLSNGRGRVNLKIFDDGTEAYEFTANPWYGNEYPLPYGRTTASYPLPRVRTDIVNLRDQWKTRVSEAMRVPVDVMGKGVSGNKSATEAETSNRMFRGAVTKAREDVTEFIEEAWARGMGRIEERYLIEGIESIMAERERSKVSGNYGTLSGINEDRQGFDLVEALEKDRPVSKETLSKRQEIRRSKGQPLGAITPEERKRAVRESQAANLKQAFYEDMTRKAQSMGVTIDTASMYKTVDQLVEERMARPVQNENTEYNDITAKEARLKTKKSQIAAGDISPTGEDVSTSKRKKKQKRTRTNDDDVEQLMTAEKIIDGVNQNSTVLFPPSEELDPNPAATEFLSFSERDIMLTALESWFKRALKQRRRLKLFWMMPPVSDPADIVFAMNQGSLAREVGNAMIKAKMKIPIDTPSGELKEVTIEKAKAKLQQQSIKMNNDHDMQKTKEVNKAKMTQMKTQQQQKQQQSAAVQTTTPAPATTKETTKDNNDEKKEEPKSRQSRTRTRQRRK